MSTIQDVAKKAGVSVSTVYKVFSDNYNTRAKITEKVLSAAKELNYVHNAGAERSNRKVLGLMFSEPRNPFTNELIQMIIDELYLEYEIIVLFSNEDVKQEQRNILQFEKMGIDALIFAAVSNDSYPIIEKMSGEGKPVVQFFMQNHKGVDAVLFDDELGTYQAVKYLLQNGHKDILMLYKYREGFPQRANGYRRAFEEVGLKADSRFIYDIPYEDSIRVMIQSKIRKLKPTAVLAVNEIISVATVAALREMRLSYPEDISLVLYDDLNWAAATGITCVGHSFESAGTLCKSILSRANESRKPGEHKPVKLVIDPMIIARDSVGFVK